MIEIKQTNPAPDATTSGYDVVLDKTYTVLDFMYEVLKTRRRDWGTFRIAVLGLSVEYRYGMLKKPEWSHDLLYSKVSSVSASGGWTHMDYVITVNREANTVLNIGPVPFLEADLFDDPRDMLIILPRNKIDSFKRYDAKRKEYYSKAMQRLGMLESLLDEIKDCDSLGLLKEKIVNQQAEITNLHRLKDIAEMYKKIRPEQVDNVESIAKLIIENESLKAKLESKDCLISKLLRERKENNV